MPEVLSEGVQRDAGLCCLQLGQGHVDFHSFVVTLTPLSAHSVAGTAGDACALTSLLGHGASV